MVVVFFHCHVSVWGNNISHYASTGLVYYVYLHLYPQNYPKCTVYTSENYHGFTKNDGPWNTSSGIGLGKYKLRLQISISTDISWMLRLYIFCQIPSWKMFWRVSSLGSKSGGFMGYPLETLQKTSKCKLIIAVVIVGPLSRLATWEDHPRTCKWIITITTKSPHWELFPFPSMAIHGL